MIGFCKKVNRNVLSEADCYFCKDVDLTCCRYWRELSEKKSGKNTIIVDGNWHNFQKELPTEEKQYLLYCCNDMLGNRRHYYYEIGLWKYGQFVCVSQKYNIIAWLDGELPDPPNFHLTVSEIENDIMKKQEE